MNLRRYRAFLKVCWMTLISCSIPLIIRQTCFSNIGGTLHCLKIGLRAEITFYSEVRFETEQKTKYGKAQGYPFGRA